MNSFKKRLENTKRYTSFQEKEALIESLNENIDKIKIANILGLSPRNEIEAEAFIFKARERSVSEVIEVTSNCPTCNKVNISNVEIESLFYNDILDNSIPEGLFEGPEEISEEIFNFDDLSIEEYEILEEKINKNNKCIFNPLHTVLCIYCQNKYDVYIEATNIISNTSLTNLYEQYSDLTYYSHLTKEDIDKMYPFEREIFLGLLQKKIDAEE